MIIDKCSVSKDRFIFQGYVVDEKSVKFVRLNEDLREESSKQRLNQYLKPSPNPR